MDIITVLFIHEKTEHSSLLYRAKYNVIHLKLVEWRTNASDRINLVIFTINFYSERHSLISP